MSATTQIGGWKVKDLSFISNGSDPTWVMKYELSRGDAKIIVSEFQLIWEAEINYFGFIGRDGEARINDMLEKHGAPNLNVISKAFNKIYNDRAEYEGNIYGGP